MYNAQYSNNPFIDDPTTSSTKSRYPDLNTLEYSSSGNSSGYASPSGYGYNPSFGQQVGYNSQLGQQQMQMQYTQPQMQPSLSGWQQPQVQMGQYSTQGYSTPGPLSPSISGLPYQGNTFGQQYPTQQIQQQYTGYPSSQYGAQGYQSYGSQQQMRSYSSQPTPNVLEFDPLAQSQSQSQSQFQSQASFTTSRGPNGNLHPREFIRTHKQELEIWDLVSWKQALNSFNDLRNAWESHKIQIGQRIQQGGYYLGAAETQRLQGVSRVTLFRIIDLIHSNYFLDDETGRTQRR